MMEFLVFLMWVFLAGIQVAAIIASIDALHYEESAHRYVLDLWLLSVKEDGASIGGLLIRILTIPSAILLVVGSLAIKAIRAFFGYRIIKPRKNT